MNIKYLPSLFIPALFISVTCLAAEVNEENEKLFRELDTDKNNVISVEEAENSTVLLQQFDEIDKDNNELLDSSEFSAFEGVERFEPPVLDEPGVGAAPLE